MRLHDRMARPHHQDVLDVDQLAGVHQALADEFARRAYRKALVRSARCDARLDRELISVAEIIARRAEPGETVVLVHARAMPFRKDRMGRVLWRLKRIGLLCWVKCAGPSDPWYHLQLSSRWMATAA